jgi:hypothetical protein
MRFPFFRNRDSVKNGILISIRRTGDGFHPGLFSHLIENLADSREQYQMDFIKCQYTDDYLLTKFARHVFEC